MASAERVLSIAGTRNLRDIGGYPTNDGRQTRWRTVYRSDELCRLDNAAQASFRGLKIRTIVDLRGEEETSVRPNIFSTSELLTYRGLPFWERPAPADGVVDISKGYHRELDLRGERLTSIIRLFTEPQNLPALVHCAAGKDRTGVVIGLLLAALGVEEQAIVADYVMSRTCLGEPYLEESRKWVTDRGWSWDEVAHLYDSPPHRMQNTPGPPAAEVGRCRELPAAPWPRG